MKLVAEKYRKLRPELSLLSDEVVLSQAWKKTHGYMRTHNWYADTLELDISALGIEENAIKWKKTLALGRFQLQPLESVPAAKSEPWIMDAEKGWTYKDPSNDRREKPPIRPLAHLTVRDQTWSTAVMMCLADAVETIQGNCSLGDAHSAQKRNVYSYGNRLVCDWKNDEAWFRWGNGETYRKFFIDYQNFLKRPIQIGRSVANNLSDSNHVFILNLDLSKFYDNIDRSFLMDRLKTIAVEYDSRTVDTKFWNTAKKIMNWEWSEEAKKTAAPLGLNLGTGLPQGLVASGFFANAYMIQFDQFIGRSIGESIGSLAGIVLHDYCRYVDDLRLVVSVGSTSADDTVKAINTFISKNLKRMLEKK